MWQNEAFGVKQQFFVKKCNLDQNQLAVIKMKSKEEKKLNIMTDCAPVKGGADYTFICKKIPFTVTCTSDLAPGAYNYIDLDLVNKMRIPLLNIKVTRMLLHGQDVRVVGSISQTVQWVNKGRVQ